MTCKITKICIVIFIVNFPFLDGDVPRRTPNRVYISQLIRFVGASSRVCEFSCRNKALTTKILKQGYRYHKLRMAFSVLSPTEWVG